jgi:hypothetical protein
MVSHGKIVKILSLKLEKEYYLVIKLSRKFNWSSHV